MRNNPNDRSRQCSQRNPNTSEKRTQCNAGNEVAEAFGEWNDFNVVLLTGRTIITA